ncbi:MAG: tyrosine-type recombinase/integrase [Peptococcaceae bacterium]|nr:tyrosine-type recombinase/integrase [Peptococcaceae bacterium]
MVDNLVNQILHICLNAQEPEKLKSDLVDLLSRYEIRKITPGSTDPDVLQKMELFLLAKRMEGMSERTVKNYRKTLRDFGSYVEKPVSEITTRDIRDWLSSCSQLKMSTIRYYISVLRSFYDYLLTEELVTTDPTRKIKLPKLEQRMPKALSIDELEILREGCRTLRDKALLETFYASGCRLSEIHGLNRTDINWRERSFVVLGKGNKERVVFIGARAAHALRKYLSSRTDQEKALFVTERGKPRRLSQRSIHEIFKKIASRAGIQKNIHPHVFRHSFASTMLNHGATLEDVQALLGHASPNTTQVYAQVSLERKKQAYNLHFVN